jgi:hypothetical protein
MNSTVERASIFNAMRGPVANDHLGSWKPVKGAQWLGTERKGNDESLAMTKETEVAGQPSFGNRVSDYVGERGLNPFNYMKDAITGLNSAGSALGRRFASGGPVETAAEKGRPAGIEYGITNKSRVDYRAAEGNRKRQAAIKYEAPPETPAYTSTTASQVRKESFALPNTKMILENAPKSPISSDRGKFSLEQTIRSLGR